MPATAATPIRSKNLKHSVPPQLLALMLMLEGNEAHPEYVVGVLNDSLRDADKILAGIYARGKDEALEQGPAHGLVHERVARRPDYQAMERIGHASDPAGVVSEAIDQALALGVALAYRYFPDRRCEVKARSQTVSPTLFALMSSAIDDGNFTREGLLSITAAGDRAARKLLAKGPLDHDGVFTAARSYADATACVRDALGPDYNADPDALRLASEGYIEGALVLGMALMYHMLHDAEGGVR